MEQVADVIIESKVWSRVRNKAYGKFWNRVGGRVNSVSEGVGNRAKNNLNNIININQSEI